MSGNKKKEGKSKDEPEAQLEEEEDFFNMEELFERRPKIVEKIFKLLDNKSLTICREVSTSWKEFIDTRKYPWTRICQKFYPSDQDRMSNNFEFLNKSGLNFDCFLKKNVNSLFSTFLH